MMQEWPWKCNLDDWTWLWGGGGSAQMFIDFSLYIPNVGDHREYSPVQTVTPLTWTSAPLGVKLFFIIPEFNPFVLLSSQGDLVHRQEWCWWIRNHIISCWQEFSMDILLLWDFKMQYYYYTNWGKTSDSGCNFSRLRKEKTNYIP